MGQLQKRIIFLICFILLLPTMAPMAATNAQLVQTIDYSPNTMNLYNHFTSNGDFLVGEVSLSRETGRWIYRTDLSLIAGDQKQKTVQTENTRMFNFNGKIYIGGFYDATNTFTLYDEQLNIIDSFAVALLNNTSYVYINQYNNYIIFSQQVHDRITGQLTAVSRYYNTKTNSFENYVETFVDYVYVNEKMGIVFTNQLGEIKKIIPITNIRYTGRPYDVIYTPNKLIMITNEHSSEQSTFNFYTLNMNGNVLDTKTMMTSANTSLNYFVQDDIVKLELYDYNAERIVQNYDYNLSTYTLVNGAPIERTTTEQIADNVFVEYEMINDQYVATYKNADGTVITSFNTYDASTREFKSGYANEYNLLIETSNSQRNFARAQLYDLKTNKLIADVSGATDYQLTNKPNYLYALEGKNIGQNSYYETLNGFLYYFGEDMPIEKPQPVNPTEDRSKMWIITTSKAIDASKVTSNNVYVKDANGQNIAITYSFNGNQLFVHAPKNGYEPKQTYTLYVEDLISTDGSRLTEPKSKQFTIQ